MQSSTAITLPRGPFGAVLCDPPWSFRTWGGRRMTPHRCAEDHYRTMTTAELQNMALPLSDVCARDCALFMWVVDSHLDQAMTLARCWGFCTGVGTRTLTDDLRWVPAEELRVGDGLLAFDENIIGGRRYYRRGTVLSTGIERMPSYRVILETGEEVVANAEHPWLTTFVSKSGKSHAHRWVRTKDMQPRIERYGVGLALPRLAPVVLPDSSYQSGFLAGAFDSEGSLSSGKGGIRFSQRDNPLMGAVKDALRSRGYGYTEYDRKVDDCRQIYLRGGLGIVMRFMMECRPPRLLERWRTQKLVSSLYNLEKIKVAAVEYLGKRECVTLMTDTGTYISEGFGSHNTYKTRAFVWVKTTLRDPTRTRVGFGYWTRKESEECLLFTRGRPRRLSASVRQVVMAPRREHSRKPDEVHERIEALVGGPYLELFARHRRPGWEAWGDELPPLPPRSRSRPEPRVRSRPRVGHRAIEI